MRFLKGSICLLAISSLMFVIGCAPKIARPDQLLAPTPISGNSGEYMCPYTQDGVLAEWTDKAIKASMGAAIGGTLGAYAGAKLLEQVPFVGGFLGQKAGEAIGRKIIIESAGGMEFIKEKSDLSFNNVNDLSVYLYVKHSTHEHFQEALKAVMALYPEMKQGYYSALVSASK